MQGEIGTSLYERWRETANRRGNAVALRALPGDGSWTFADLAALAARSAPAPGVMTVSSTGPAFILDVLRAWRDNSLLVPDDSGGAFAFDASQLPGGHCHMKITSGSSGARQGILFTGRQLAADADQIVATMGLHQELPNLGVISMAHSYGFSNLVLPLLLHGIPLWLAENPLPETLRGILAATPPLALPAVPAMWRAWEQSGVDFRPVAVAISAGAPLPLALESSVFDRCGLKIHNFYGSSECGGIAYDRTTTPRADARFTGTALAGVALSLDEASGCLVVESAATGDGYLGAPAPFSAGRFATRDLAELGPAGEVFLSGRAGESINVAGYKVAPGSLEDTLLRVPGVRACVVFGVPSTDPIRGDDVVAVVNASTGLADLKAALASMPSPCQPRHWWIRPDLVADGRGKIAREYWKQAWLATHRPVTPPHRQA